MRLVEKGFSEEEWAVLGGYPAFMERVKNVSTIDEADAVIRAGAEILETRASGSGKHGMPPDVPPQRRDLAS